MGIRPSFPLKQEPIRYEPDSFYDCLGERRPNDFGNQITVFHKLQEKYWVELIKERERDLEAKMKFKDMDNNAVLALIGRFPSFNTDDIEDLRLQFQSFDLNRDGLIDSTELMQVLDDLGDKSDVKTRHKYFSEVDEDKSGAIDFEEFLGLIHRLGEQSVNEQGSNSIGALCKRGSENVQTLRQLTIQQQMDHGLF